MSASVVIVLTAMLVGIACAVPGCFLVLRRSAMLGDAISHSVLLGIVAVYWLGGGRSPLVVLVAATLSGVLTVFLVAAVKRTGLVADDAAIGLVFPAMFAAAVIGVSALPPTVHLDTEHLLFGEIAFAPLDWLTVGGLDLGYRTLWLTGGMALLNVLLAVALFKELKLTTFDPQLAESLGFRPRAVGLGLMTVTAATVTVAFDSVGAILAIGLLIVPAATAHLLTDRLGAMLAVAAALAGLAGLGGYLAARAMDASISGMMVTVAGILFAMAMLFAPRHGVLARRRGAGRLDPERAPA